jgi:exopolysaccharide biosynthesis polyprenyl glycosylphosphotransferase
MLRLRTIVLFLGDLLVLVAGYILATIMLGELGYIWPPLDLDLFLIADGGIFKILLVAATIMAGLYLLGLYNHFRVDSLWALTQDLLLVFGAAFLVQAFVAYGRSTAVLPRWSMLIGSVIGGLGLLSWRWLYSQMMVRHSGKRRVLFLGDTPLVRRVAEFIHQSPERGYEVIGCISNSGADDFPGGPIIPLTDDLNGDIQRLQPDRVAVAGSDDLDPEIRHQLMLCSMMGLNVESVGTLHEELFERVAIETVTINQLVYSPFYRPRITVTTFQEFYGRLIALIGILLTWPVMLITAIAVRLESGSPVLFRQIRLGKNGVPFVFLKFRSMYVDADKRAGGPVRAKENDPRVTRVGRIIRLTRIDELPQFFNVLRGEMTLVGPRPEMPEFEAELVRKIPLYTQRHRVKPGITGWAQIHHEPEDSIANTVRKLEYDLYYIKHMSPLLDFLTMLHTARAVIFRIGAR